MDSDHMKCQQEQYARDLYQSLKDQVGKRQLAAKISIEGGGVHWSCIAERDNSSCSISCYDHSGPEFYLAFYRDAEECATARITSKIDTLAVVKFWLTGRTLSEVYDKYLFLNRRDFDERHKRELMLIKTNLLLSIPDLEDNASIQIEHQGASFYHLNIRAQDRSGELFTIGEEKQPDVFFAWGDCVLFRFKVTDQRTLAQVVKRWICERVMPSTMQAEFPWIEMSEVAEYYEQGNPIEGEFIVSWDIVDDFYDYIIDSHDYRKQIRTFMGSLRKKGYDRLLRAGQSMSTFVLSRSRRHGMVPGDPSLAFHFMDDHIIVYNGLNGGRSIETRCQTTELNPEIDALLQELIAKPIG